MGIRRKPELEENQCHIWVAYGDRARLFIALVYPFLRTRRKAQVDSAGILEFLEGRDPASLSRAQIVSLLDSRMAFCSKHDPDAKAKKALQKSQAYFRRREDPVYVEKCRIQSALGNHRARIKKEAASQPERVM